MEQVPKFDISIVMAKKRTLIQMVLVPFATKNLALGENQVKCLVYHKKYLIPDI